MKLNYMPITTNTEPSPEQIKLKEVAGKIEEILVANGYALQPYLDFSEHAIRPSVRLLLKPVATAGLAQVVE